MNPVEQPQSAYSISADRTFESAISFEQSPLKYSATATRSLQQNNPNEQPNSARSTISSRFSYQPSIEQPPSVITTRSSQQNNTNEQPNSARSTTSSRLSSIEQPPYARSLLVGPPHLGVKTVSTVPASVPITLKLPSPATSSDVHVARDKRYPSRSSRGLFFNLNNFRSCHCFN